MPGLLDMLGSNDPQSEAMRQGLLQMGLELMQAKGNVGEILGQAGQRGVAGMQGFQDRQFQEKLRQQQLADIARKKVLQGREDQQYQVDQNLQKLPAQFYRPGAPGGIDATGGMETDTMAPNNAQPGRMDMVGLQNALFSTPGGFKEGLALQGQLRKDAPTIHSLGAGGGAYVGPDGKVVRIPGDSQHADSADMQAIIARYGKGTPEYNKALEALIAHKTNPAPMGFMRDEKGNLKVDPIYDEAQQRWRSAATNAAATAREKLAKGQALAPEDTQMMAEQYLAGDKSVLVGLGRGAQSASNIIAVRKAIREGAAARGMTGADLAAKLAEYGGTLAAQRTVGTRSANIEVAGAAFESQVPIALAASKEVERSGFLPFGKAQVMFNEQTNNPAMRRLAAANNALVNTYARAINPQGVGTVHDKEHAREILMTAFDGPSYEAVVNQMLLEIQAEKIGIRKAKGAITDNMNPGAPKPAVGGWSITLVN